MKKKITALLLLFAALLSFIACDGDKPGEGKETTSAPSSSASVPYEEETVDPSLDEIAVDLFE